MNIIANNPYRILGVLSNASKKEIIANQGKIKAFIKTGKTISFENDFDAILSPIVRSNELLAQAVNATSLPKDRVAAGLFWFMSITKFDEIALNHLRNGDKDSAISILRKKPTVSACINIAIINLLEENWGTALYYYAYLFNSEERRQELLALLTENIGNVTEKEIVSVFVDNLLLYNTTINWMDFLLQHEVEIQGEIKPIGNFYLTSNLYEIFKNRITTNTLKDIENCLNTASSVKKEDPKANINAARTLETKSKILLRSLRACIGKDNKKYITLSDKIANQILNNCIDYYNYEKNDPNRAREIIALLRYAFRTAEGQLVKDRCKKNLDIIKEENDRLTPQSVEGQAAIIYDKIKNFNTNNRKSLYVDLQVCLSELSKIRTILKNMNSASGFYLNISSEIVNAAINVVVDVVNETQEKYVVIKKGVNTIEHNEFSRSIKWAMSIMDMLSLFAKDPKCLIRFNENYATLRTLDKRYNYSTQTVQQTSKVTIKNKVADSLTYTHPKTPFKPPVGTKENESELGYIIIGVLAFTIMIAMLFYIVLSYDSYTSSSYNVKQNTTENTAIGYTLDNIEPNSHDTSEKNQDEIWLEKYRWNSLSTGATPYKAKYGGNSKSGNAGISIKGPIGTDVLVIIKNESGAVVKHAYIQAAQTYKFRVKPGIYQPFFIFGQSWCPEKPAPNGEYGYFLESVSINKDSPQKIGEYQELEYTLQTVENGNFHAAYSNSEEAF